MPKEELIWQRSMVGSLNRCNSVSGFSCDACQEPLGILGEIWNTSHTTCPDFETEDVKDDIQEKEMRVIDEYK